MDQERRVAELYPFYCMVHAPMGFGKVPDLILIDLAETDGRGGGGGVTKFTYTNVPRCYSGPIAVYLPLFRLQCQQDNDPGYWRLLCSVKLGVNSLELQRLSGVEMLLGLVTRLHPNFNWHLVNIFHVGNHWPHTILYFGNTWIWLQLGKLNASTFANRIILTAQECNCRVPNGPGYARNWIGLFQFLLQLHKPLWWDSMLWSN